MFNIISLVNIYFFSNCQVCSIIMSTIITFLSMEFPKLTNIIIGSSYPLTNICLCGYKVFPRWFIKNTIHFPLNIIDPFQILADHICSFISVLLVLFHLPCVYFHASTILFWILLPCSILWNHEVWCIWLCFSFWKLLWLFRDLLWYHVNFRIIFFFSCETSHYNFDRNCINVIDGFEYYRLFDNVHSSNLWTHISFYLFESSSFSFNNVL